jgi:chromosome segregation ATPase
MQQSSGTPNVGQQSQMSSSNGQRAEDTIRECEMQFEAALSKLRQSRSEAIITGKKLAYYETSFNNLQKVFRAMKKEKEEQEKELNDLKQAYGELLVEYRRVQLQNQAR